MPDRAREKVSRVMPELRGDEVLLDRQADDGVAVGRSEQRNKIAADPLLGRTQLQVFLQPHLAPELGDHAAQHGAGQRGIGGDGNSESVGGDEKKMGLLVNAGAHQVGLAAKDGGWNDQIDRPQQLDKRLHPIAHAQQLDAAGEEELRKNRGLSLLEQQAPGWYTMQHGLGRQAMQCARRNVPQPDNALERIARGGPWPWIRDRGGRRKIGCRADRWSMRGPFASSLGCAGFAAARRQGRCDQHHDK